MEFHRGKVSRWLISIVLLLIASHPARADSGSWIDFEPQPEEDVTLIQVAAGEAASCNINLECTPETPSVWLAIKKSFSMDVISKFHTGPQGGTSAEVKFTVDLNPLRELLIDSKIFERDTKNFGTYAVDLLLVTAVEAVGGVIEWAILKQTGADTQWTGAERFYNTIREKGLSSLPWQGIGWKDGNFGTWNNTIHGVPFYLASAFFRARGYNPLVSALAGFVTHFVIHETLFENWEQPKSGHDFIMNSLSALAGAIPGVGQEIQYSPYTGQMTSRFYVEDADLGRVFIGFEQFRSYKGMAVEDMPVRPWNFQVGLETPVADHVSVGGFLNFLTDEQEQSNFWKTFQWGLTQIGVYLRVRLP